MKNKQGIFESWILRVKLCLLQMNVFTAENVDENVLPQYWEELYNAELNPVEAIKEQGLYKRPQMDETDEYLKYTKR